MGEPKDDATQVKQFHLEVNFDAVDEEENDNNEKQNCVASVENVDVEIL